MRYSFLTLGFFFVIGKELIAQDCQFIYHGIVKDFHNNQPMEGATIFLKTLNLYTTTDINGKFKFENICKDKIAIQVSHLGCETKEMQKTISKNTFQTIFLEHHPEILEEITFIEKKIKKSGSSNQETILNRELIDNYTSQNLGDILKEVNGISSINTGDAIAKPIINGLHSSRVAIFQNNVRLQDHEWGVEHSPSLDINSASAIAVIKGASALAYGGDAIGGAIILYPFQYVKKDSLFGKIIMVGQSNGRGGTLNASLFKTDEKGWFFNVQGKHKMAGDLQSPNYFLSNTGTNSTSVSLNAGNRMALKGWDFYYSFLNNEIGILGWSHIGNVEDLIDAINRKTPLNTKEFSYEIVPPKQLITHHLGKVSFFNYFRNFGKLNLQYDYQNNRRKEFDKRIGTNKNKASLDLRLQTHSFSGDIKIKFKESISLNMGSKMIYQENFPNPETGVRRLIPDYEKWEVGSFITSNWKLNEKIIIEGAFRYDWIKIDAKKFYIKSRWESLDYDIYFADIILQDLGTQILANPIFEYNNFSTSIGINYQLNNNTILFNYSLANRAPNPSELFSDGLHHAAASIELGNLRIRTETASRFGSTYNYEGNFFKTTIDVFYNRIQNYIVSIPVGVETTLRGAFPVWNYQQTDAILWGIDTAVSYYINDKWQITNKISFIEGKDKKKNDFLINIPPLKTINSIIYKNKGKTKWHISLKSEWALMQNNFPNNNFEQFIPKNETFAEVDISTPPNAYHLASFEGGIDFFKNKLNFSIRINNIFNTVYRNYLNRLRYFSDDSGRNILLQLTFNY